MDKEMKKLLLVSVSVGVFLLITITVALIVLTPKTLNKETVFSSSVPLSHARPVPNIDNSLDQLATNALIAAANENGERSEAVIAADKSDGNKLTIQVPMPESTAIPETTHTPAAAKTAPAAPATAPATAAKAAPAPSQTPAASQSAAQQKSQTTAAAASSRTSASTKTINDFWIQTGAYPSMVGAEDIRETLANNGLVGIVSIFEDGRTWYRVRLGPYTSEKEANHWLAIVKSINGFDKSEVRQTIRQQ